MNQPNFTPEELDELKTIKVGKWDIISEYSRINWLNKGHNEEEAKIHGIVVAISGYRTRTGGSPASYKFVKRDGVTGTQVTHRKKEKWITSADFDKIIHKMGKKYYQQVFSPAIQALYDQGYSYAKVKKAIDIPSTIGAKVTLDKFVQFLE
ncbi:MAG: hypothetical protein ACFFCQ_07725 [Promethearchaeota archaeon]